MRQLYLTLALLSLLSPAARACDICGCFMGITPYDNQSGISLMHRYRIFNGYQQLGQPHQFFPAGVQPFVPSHPNQDTGYEHNHQGDATDYEAYRVVELRGKYFLAKRLELNAFVPYVMNTSQSNGRQLNTAGLGDVTVFAGYHLIRAIETMGVQSRLIVGGGAKLPTGDYQRTNPRGQRYSMLNQPGTGTTDGFLYLNYIGSFHNVGLSLNSSYRRSTRNQFENSLAPSTASFANLFYRVALGSNWQIYPSAQLYYEKTKGEMLDGQLTYEHAMNDALLGPGLDIYYKNFSLNTSAQFPIYTVTTDHPAGAGRMVIAVGYSFKQTKYLLKGRTPGA
ncbi:transporter [Hymenobacter cellulosivorans]|uniref:Transporter n=1 Tax=Hymenobacter cellulosivorans TaxID=2932249 RepID=A0ABY4FHL8_9BACT|nr:transporter [Hymenobacter cellulosivorans]UOQ55512.1 transporter [Hymenobacter cellulosivorans]